MSKKGDKMLARMERRPAGGNIAQVVEDPISIGLDKSISIDMSRLPPPDRSYDADFAWVEHRQNSVSLFFAKRNRDEPGTVRTRLEVRYPPENLVAHFWSNSREFHGSLRRFVERWPADEERNKLDPASMKSQREASEWANFDTMAHAGSEAAIDFFRLPPRGLAMFAQGKGSSGLTITPVVRVQLSVFELLRLLDSAAEAVAKIEAYMPRPEPAAGEKTEVGR